MMEREIVLKLDEEFVLPQITPDVRRRQVAIPARMAPDCDLNHATLDWALAILGGLEPGTTAFLVVPEEARDRAEALGKEFRLAVIVLPPEMMRNSYCWALASAKGVVYSVPSS